MSQMVKAAVLVEPGKIEIQEFPRPQLGEGAAIARMVLSGICGTDKHSYKGESVQNKGTKNEIHIPYPIIQGHENVLIIEEIDDIGARKLDYDGNILKPGDRVTMCPDVVCGECWYCKNMPTYPWCEKMLFSYGNMRSCLDSNHLYGGFSEYIYIEPHSRLYKIPDGLPDNIAVLTEVLCVTWTLDKAKEFNSFSLEGFNFNDTVVIQGVGPLGLAHVIKARMMGAGKIIVTDISDYKLNLAKEFGADIAINSKNTTEDERVELIMQQTHGRGADLVVECVGRASVFNEGLRMLRKAGMYLEPGNFVDTGSVPVNVHEICAKNLRIIGMCNHAHNAYLPCMEMMERSLKWFPWDKFVSHVYPLSRAEEAIKKSISEDSMKVAIAPNM